MQWEFRAVRPGRQRSPIKRGDGSRVLNGSSADALDFATRAEGYLRPKGVWNVEAWSNGPVDEICDAEPSGKHVTFTIRQHPDGDGWLADKNHLHHGGRWKDKDLDAAINYALFRGGGLITRIEVRDGSGKLLRVILANQSRIDYTPTIAASGGRGDNSPSPHVNSALP